MQRTDALKGRPCGGPLEWRNTGKGVVWAEMHIIGRDMVLS